MPVEQIIVTDDDNIIATAYCASQDKAEMVIRQPVGPDGRSEWSWFILANGDVILGCFPRGNTFEQISDELQP